MSSHAEARALADQLLRAAAQEVCPQVACTLAARSQVNDRTQVREW